MRHAVYDHIAVDDLVRGVERHLTAVAALAAPTCRSSAEKHAVAVIGDLCIVECDLGRGVIDEEHIAVLVGERAAVHGKARGALRCIAGHGLIDHHRLVPARLVAVLFVVIGGEVDVIERDSVLALYHNTLRGS